MEYIRMRSHGRAALFRIYLRVHAYKHTGTIAVNQVLDTRQENSPSERTASVGVYKEAQLPLKFHAAPRAEIFITGTVNPWKRPHEGCFSLAKVNS